MAPEANDNWSDETTFACVTCRFFVPKANSEVLGRCRRNAPVVEKGWPAVYISDWCGEHKMGSPPR